MPSPHAIHRPRRRVARADTISAHGPARRHATAKERRGLDFDALADALSRVLADRFETTEVTVTGLQSPEKAGTSSGTILFTVSWSDRGQRRERDLVIRTQPDQVQLYRDADFHRQYAVLDARHRSGRVRVPEPLFFESDPSLVGVPFFVMEQLHGNVPVTFPGYNVSGFLFDATLTQRRGPRGSPRSRSCAGSRVLVEEMQFLDQPELGPTALEQQFEYWRGSVTGRPGTRPPTCSGRSTRGSRRTSPPNAPTASPGATRASAT